jgi:hypothetical protein
MASGASPFAACVRAQATSSELVVFAPSVGQAVEIAWYVSSFSVTYLQFDDAPCSTGLCPMAVASYLKVSVPSCDDMASTGHAFAP